MSLEYTIRGPTSVQISGPVLTPLGPMEIDSTPIVVQDAIVVNETVSIHYTTRTLFVTDPITTHEAASKDVTPIHITDALTATLQVALAVKDTLTTSEVNAIGPAAIGSPRALNPAVGFQTVIGSAMYVSRIIYGRTDVIGSTRSLTPAYTPTTNIGSTFRFIAALPTASASDHVTVTERLDVIQHPLDHPTLHESLGREWDINVTEHVNIVVDNVSSGPLVLEHVVVTETIGRIISFSIADTPTVHDALALGMGEHLTFTERFGFERDVLEHVTLAESIAVTTSLNDHLAFTEVVSSLAELPAEDDLVVFDVVSRVYPFSLSDALSIADNLSGQGVLVAPQDALIVVESVTPSNIYNRNIHDTLVVADGVVRVGAIMPGNTAVCQEGYVPAVPLGTRGNVVLTWPYIGPSLTVTLRNPKFGNEDTVNTNTRFDRTRSGQLSVVRDPTWPVIEVLKVAFEGLTEAQKLQFEDFITESAALEIGYLDQENRQWRGWMTMPSFDTVQVGIGCQFNVSFEFRGRLA